MSSETTSMRGTRLARLNRLVWFGALGGPAAWAAQFLFGMQFGLARCESPAERFPFQVHAISAALGGSGALVALLAGIAAIFVFRATSPDPKSQQRMDVATGRLHFLAAVGMTVSPLTLVLCGMVAIGVPLLGLCRQS